MQPFREALRHYRSAHQKCAKLSGEQLEDALNSEANALAELAMTRATTLGHIIQKVCVLRDLMRTEWSDGRDMVLLNSIYRDLRHSVNTTLSRMAAVIWFGAGALPYGAAIKIIFVLALPGIHYGMS